MIHKAIKIALPLLLLISSHTLNAQGYVEKQSAVTVGYGFPNLYKALLKTSIEANQQQGYYYDETFGYKVKGYGPLFVKYEYALTKLIGLGASFGYWSTKFTETYNYQDGYYDANSANYVYTEYQDVTEHHFSSLSAGARLNFHFGTQEKLDPYAGVAAGYTSMNYTYKFSSTNPNTTDPPSISYSGIPVYFAITAGIRYYFTENIGAYAELGLDKWSVIQGGLAIKF